MAAVEHKRQAVDRPFRLREKDYTLHKKDDGAARKTMGLGGPLGKTYHFGWTVSVKCFLKQNLNVDAFDSTR